MLQPGTFVPACRGLVRHDIAISQWKHNTPHHVGSVIVCHRIAYCNYHILDYVIQLIVIYHIDFIYVRKPGS